MLPAPPEFAPGAPQAPPQPGGGTSPASPRGGPRQWRARLALTFAFRDGRTKLVHNRHEGPVLVQSPFYPGDGACHAILLHPPGGLAGGDRIAIAAHAGESARALLTTPAATKWYRAEAGLAASQDATLEAAAGSALEWLPQENLFFDGARARVRTRVRLDPEARFLGWDAFCAGRPASGERFERGALGQTLEVQVGGQPVLSERLQLIGGDEAFGADWGLGGFPAAAVLLAWPGDGLLETAREHARRLAPAPGRSGVTLLDGLLVARALAPGILGLTAWLHGLWAALRPLVLDCDPLPPRIWAT